MRVWIPWPVWLVIVIFGFPMYLMWACVATATFVVVSLIAMAVTRSFKRGLRAGGLTFAAMIVPGHMVRAHNERRSIVNVRVVA